MLNDEKALSSADNIVSNTAAPETLQHKFRTLLLSTDTLKLDLALREDPTLITQQDEEGATILHHIVEYGAIAGKHTIAPILDILFKTPGLDFHIKDIRRDTPLHIAAALCYQETTSQFLFPALVQAAEKHNFNFSTLDQEGNTVLHIATKTQYEDIYGKKTHNGTTVIAHAANPGLNVLSAAGKTAFFYAVKQAISKHSDFDFSAVDALLNAGADPILHESNDDNPLTMLEKYFELLNNVLNRNIDLAPDKQQWIENRIAQLSLLNKRIYATPYWISYNEIKKNALMLAQASRTTAFFKDISLDLQKKIAGLTGDPQVHDIKQTEKIVSKYRNQLKEEKTFLHAVKQIIHQLGDFKAVNALLDAGVDPILHGADDENPLPMLEEHLEQLKIELFDTRDPKEQQWIENRITQISQLNKRICATPHWISYNEIKKNARMLAQASRTTTLFKDISPKLQRKIAGLTGDPQAHDTTQAEKIASKHYNRLTH